MRRTGGGKETPRRDLPKLRPSEYRQTPGVPPEQQAARRALDQGKPYIPQYGWGIGHPGRTENTGPNFGSWGNAGYMATHWSTRRVPGVMGAMARYKRATYPPTAPNQARAKVGQALARSQRA